MCVCAMQDALGLTPFAIACAAGDLDMVAAIAGDRDAVSAREAGKGRVLHGKWIIGVGPAALVKSVGGHTPVTLAVRVLLHLHAYVDVHVCVGRTCLWCPPLCVVSVCNAPSAPLNIPLPRRPKDATQLS